MQRTVLLSQFCPSVHPSDAWIVTELNDGLRIYWYHTKRQSLQFVVSGWWAMPPSLWNLCWKRPTPFEKCRLQPISAYNASTIRDSEKSLIMTYIKLTTGFPTSYRWSAYVILKSRKGGSKSNFFHFFEQKSTQSNKVCYKVSLRENFPQQSCSTTISTSNGP